MVYDLGSKNSLFKYISLILHNTYMSKLQVSNEYTLDLAKCIYSYLGTYFPQQQISSSTGSILLTDSIAEYYLKGKINKAKLNYIIILPEYDLGEPKQICGVYKYGGKLDDIPLYDFNVDNLSCRHGVNTLWEILPETAPYYNTSKMWQYLPLAGTQFMDTPEDILEDFCVYIGCNPNNEYYKHFYIKGLNNTYVDVTSAISGYLFLEKVFSTDDYVFLSNLDDIDFSDYYANVSSVDYFTSDIGARIHPKEENVGEYSESMTIYNLDVIVIPDSILDINVYNVASWYINDTVIQYLIPGIVINENNSLDDIAQVQYQLNTFGYSTEHYGYIDDLFKEDCYLIQNYLKNSNDLVVSTGYYDIYVEGYARSLGEVRM